MTAVASKDRNGNEVPVTIEDLRDRADEMTVLEQEVAGMLARWKTEAFGADVIEAIDEKQTTLEYLRVRFLVSRNRIRDVSPVANLTLVRFNAGPNEIEDLLVLANAKIEMAYFGENPLSSGSIQLARQKRWNI